MILRNDFDYLQIKFHPIWRKSHFKSLEIILVSHLSKSPIFCQRNNEVAVVPLFQKAEAKIVHVYRIE